MLDTTHRSSLRRIARAELEGLHGFARHLVGDAADDLVQETLLRACRSFETLRDEQAAPRWLRVIMVNAWRDRARRADRRPVEVPVEGDDEFSLYQRLAEVDPWPYSDTMHVDFLGSFSHRDVHDVLARLPDKYRIVLVLRYIEGFSTDEISELLELPPGTVYSHLHRGRKHLERALWAYAVESGLVSDDGDQPEATS